MRVALLLSMASAFTLGGGLAACSHECRSANALLPASTTTATMTMPARAINVRFVIASSAGTVAHVDLLTTTPGVDSSGRLRRDGMGHDIADPNLPRNADGTLITPRPAATASTSVARVSDFVTAMGIADSAQSWLDERARWVQPSLMDGGTARGALGRGIGNTPVLPPSPPEGPFVAIGGANSFARFVLGSQTPPAGDDAYVRLPDAGADADPVLDFAQRLRDWEWVQPAGTPPLGSTETPIAPLADLVVVRRNPPEHDLAFVARAAVRDMGGQVITGGDLVVLDIDDPEHVISLTTITFNSYADMGLTAVPTGLVHHHGLIYVALDHQNFFPMASTRGPGLIALVDPDRREVQTVLRAPNVTGCTSIAPFNPPERHFTTTPPDDHDPGEASRLVVTCMGSPPATPGAPPSDGGFLYIEDDPRHPNITPTIARTITTLSLAVPRADGGSMPLYGPWIAYVSRGSLVPAYLDRLIVVNLDTADAHTLTTAPPESGTNIVGLGNGAFDPASGVLVVPRGFEGVDTWQFPIAVRDMALFTFPDPIRVPIVGCGHLATRTVRVVGGSMAPVMPPNDAAVSADMGTSPDTGAPRDAGLDTNS